MKYRPLGSSEITVSEIGFGAGQLAKTLWGNQDEGEALRRVQTAREAGCYFFDTAPSDGQGRSETLLAGRNSGRAAATFAELGMAGGTARGLAHRESSRPSGKTCRRDACAPSEAAQRFVLRAGSADLNPRPGVG